jgi:multimeric flavodoxin WrbA
MKAIGIVGSPRPDGNTAILTRRCLEVLSSEGIETELIQLAGKQLSGCTDCQGCASDEICTIEDDFWPIYESMKAADVILVGSPTYFGSATPEIMAVLDRAGYIARKHGDAFAGKLGSPIAISRRAGHNFTFAQLLLWYYICGMIVPGSSYWSIGIGRHPGEVLEDLEGVKTAEDLGHRLADLLHRLKERQ